MKIGVMSDSHDNLPRIRQAVARFAQAGCERLLHAGDIVAPFAAKEMARFEGRVSGVFGNNDGEREGLLKAWPELSPAPRRLEIAGRRIVLVHALSDLGRASALDGDEAAADYLRMAEAEILISGHTHEAFVRHDHAGVPVLHVNPGETGGWVTGRATVAILDTKSLTVHIAELE